MKKLLTFLMAAVLFCQLAYAEPTLETVENSQEQSAVLVEEASLEEAEVTHGINVLTGTSKAWTCDSLPENVSIVKPAEVSLASDETYGTYLKKIAGGEWTSEDTITFAEPLPAGTYDISFKAARISATTVNTGWQPLYVAFNNSISTGTSGVNFKCFADFYTNTDGTYHNYSTTITSDTQISSFRLHGKWGGSGNYALFDDIIITPASKAINYITGTTATYDFEDKPTVDEWSSNAATISGTYTPAYLAANPNTVGNASSYVVKSTTNNNEWPQININLAQPLTAGNTYIVSFDSYKTNSDDTRDELWKPYSWDSYIIHNANKYVGEFILNKWFHKDVVIDITKDISSLKIQWRSKSGSTAEIAYFDNLRVDKAVQVTYKGTTDRVAYVKYEDLVEPELTEEDKSNSIIGWALKENASESDIITSYSATSDVVFYPVYNKITTMNYITGTAAAYDFEDQPPVNQTGSTISWQNSKPELVANPFKNDDNSSAYVLKNHTGNTYPSFGIAPAKTLTAGKYIVSFDAYKTNSNSELSAPDSTNLWVVYTGVNKPVGEFTLNKWLHKDVVIDITSDISLIKIQWETKLDVAGDEYAYFDNLRVDKAVKVTYKGTTERVAYVKYADLFEPELTEEDKSNFIIGWALTENAPETEMITSYSTTSEVVFYPVYQRPVPETLNKYSIRFGEKNGLRFAAVVDLALRKSSATEEYGFLVTRKALLGDNANDTLKVWISEGEEVWDTEEKTSGVTEENVVFVAGRAYQKSSGIDLIYDNAGGTKLDEESIKNGTAIGITVVLTNIPVKNYKDNFVVRPYVKIAGTYYYGEAKENSYYAVADAIKNNTDEYAKLTDEQKQEIADILSDSSAS